LGIGHGADSVIQSVKRKTLLLRPSNPGKAQGEGRKSQVELREIVLQNDNGRQKKSGKWTV
jgi:hypothetical protein